LTSFRPFPHWNQQKARKARQAEFKARKEAEEKGRKEIEQEVPKEEERGRTRRGEAMFTK
jgi:hypothetical protein